MITILHWDRTGQVTPVDTVDGDDGWTWVDVLAETSGEVFETTDRLGLERAVVTDAMNRMTLPIVEEYPDSVCVVVHSIEGETSQSAAELNVFIGDGYLLTLRHEPIDAINEVRQRLSANDMVVNSPASLLAHIALTAGRKYAPLIHQLEEKLDSLEELAILGNPQTVVEVAALRRDLIYLRRGLGPLYDVYDDLTDMAHPVIDKEAKRVFGRVASHHRRALESLEAGRALLGSVLETYRGAVADRTNEIMQVLTVFSAIMLPLGLIAGLWGMNFIRIPGADSENGFWILLAIMAAMALGVWVYFARRGFIGAPRLRDLPKAVGLGIFTIGTAPIRVVAEGIKQIGGQDD